MTHSHDNPATFLSDGTCRYCGHRPIKSEGRRLGLKPKQIEAILRHHKSPRPKLTQQAFSEQLGISRKTYWRIITLSYKHPKDITKITAIADLIGCEIHPAKPVKKASR